MVDSKWVCFNNLKQEDKLTIGKTYIDLSKGFNSLNCIIIKDDTGIVTEHYQPLVFITIDEWRDMQLNNILDK